MQNTDMRKVLYIIIFSLFLLLNIFLVLVTIDEYYEFFIKDCYDAFPFHHCPWGSESMGWGRRSANAYLGGLIRHFIVLCIFVVLSIYTLCKKKYHLAIWLIVLPIIFLSIWSWTEYLLFY